MSEDLKSALSVLRQYVDAMALPEPMRSPDFEQLRAAAKYLAQQLEKVLGVSPLLLDREEVPKIPLSGEQDVADSKG